jgi:Peptidase A4 family
VLRPRFVSWASVGGLVVLGTLSAALSLATGGIGGNSQASTFPGVPAIETSQVGFAGYFKIRDPVTEVSGEITVPSISSVPEDSQFGTASTWIGAQNPAGLFVQIGVTETGFGATKATGTRPPLFEAFWSDTERDFHPINIARAESGDLISLEMTLQASGWILRVRDLTSGWVHEVVTDYAAGQNFNFGSWIQEDPTSAAHPLINLPYPDMSQTMFSHAELDGAIPEMDEGEAQDMDVPGGPILVPTPDIGDSFRVVAATGFGRQYLSDLALYDYAEDQFGYVLEHGGTSDKSQIVSAASQLVRALDGQEADFEGQTWPADVSSAVQTLLSDDYLLSEDLRFITYGGYSSSRLEKVLQDQDGTVALSRHIRAELGLPPP